MKKKMEARADSWQTLAAEALSNMADWRVQHPRATLGEIETAVDERLSTLRARMLQGAAQASQEAQWSHAPKEERPRCPERDRLLVARGMHPRRLQTSGKREITLQRSYGVCPGCGTGLFPPG